jgi:hypothetical protein
MGNLKALTDDQLLGLFDTYCAIMFRHRVNRRTNSREARADNDTHRLLLAEMDRRGF